MSPAEMIKKSWAFLFISSLQRLSTSLLSEFLSGAFHSGSAASKDMKAVGVIPRRGPSDTGRSRLSLTTCLCLQLQTLKTLWISLSHAEKTLSINGVIDMWREKLSGIFCESSADAWGGSLERELELISPFKSSQQRYGNQLCSKRRGAGWRTVRVETQTPKGCLLRTSL